VELNDSENKESSKKGSSFEFLILVGVAFILSYVPIINIPFTWIMTFFHEISHGLGALLTGGSVEKISMHIRGYGVTYTQGGFRFVVLQAGYVGAVVWGILIYEMADELSHKSTNVLATFLAGLVAISALLYGRDVITWLISAVIFVLFVSIIKLQETGLMKLALKFVGIYVLLDAVRAPLNLIDGRNYGDGGQLAELTGIPEIIWVLMWLAIGIGGVLYLWTESSKPLN